MARKRTKAKKVTRTAKATKAAKKPRKAAAKSSTRKSAGAVERAIDLLRSWSPSRYSSR